MKIEKLNVIGKISYRGKENKEIFTFKHYNADEIILGKKMKDHLKFAMSYWHTLVAEGVDMFGDPTNDKSFNEKYPLSKYKASGQVIIEPNNKYLSFKFHKTGINVYSIKVTKHG